MVSGKLPAPFDGADVPDGMIWQYEVVIRDGRLTHAWALKNERGAIHIHAALSEFDGRHEWLGGVEVHSAEPFEYSIGAPSHEHCWLLGKPCWHDGSSLYFSEQIAPMLPAPYEPWKAHDMKHAHSYVSFELRSWHRDKFPTQGIEAGTAETGTGSVHESPVAESDAPQTSEDNHGQ